MSPPMVARVACAAAAGAAMMGPRGRGAPGAARAAEAFVHRPFRSLDFSRPNVSGPLRPSLDSRRRRVRVAIMSSADEEDTDEDDPESGILEIIQTLDMELEEGMESPEEMTDEMWLVLMQRKGRALAEELQRRKVEAAVRAQAHAKLHAERAAEKREMVTTLQELAETKRKVEKLALEASRVDELKDALEEQTRALEEVAESMQENEAARAAEMAKAVVRFKELEEALMKAEDEVSKIPEDLQKIEKLEQKLQKNIETMEAAVKRSEKLEADMEASKKSAAAAEEAVKETEVKLTELQKKLDDILGAEDASVIQAREELGSAEDQCKELRSMCEEALKQKVEMGEELKAAQAKGQESARKLEKISAELETKQAELDRVQQMSKQVETTLTKVEAYAAGGTEDLLSALPTGQEIPPILERLRNQLQKASVRESSVNAETEALMKANAELEAEKAKIEARVQELEEQAAAANEQMETDKARVSMIERENNKQVETSDELEARREELEHQLAQAAEAAEKSETGAVDKYPSCDELDKQLAELTAECQKLADDLEKLPSSTLVAQKEVEALTGQERRAREVLAETKTLLATTDKSLEAKEVELASHKAELEALRAEVDGRKHAAGSVEDNLRAQLEAIRAQNQALQASEREASASCEAMAIQLESSLSSTRAALQWRLQLAKKMEQVDAGRNSGNKHRSGVLAQEVRELQDKMDQNSAEIMQLTSSLSEAKSSVKAKEDQVAALLKQLENAKNNEEQRKYELESVGIMMTNLVEELEQHKALVALKESAVEKWQKEAQATKDITSQAAELGEETSALASEISRLEGELQAKEGDLASSLEARRDLEIETQALREATADLEKGVAEIRAREAAMKAAMEEAKADQNARLEGIRSQAEQEAVKAMELLTKAENAAHALGHKMSMLASEAQTTESVERGRVQELEAENVRLKVELDDKIDVGRNLSERSKVMEKDMAALRVRSARLEAGRRKDMSAQARAEEFRVKMIASRLARVDAETEKYRSQAAALEGRNTEIGEKLQLMQARDLSETDLSEQLRSASETDRALAIFARLRKLELENLELKEASDKRDKVLLRSKRFIEAFYGKKKGAAVPSKTPDTGDLTNLRKNASQFKATSKEMGQSPGPKTSGGSRAAAKMRAVAQKMEQSQQKQPVGGDGQEDQPAQQRRGFF